MTRFRRLAVADTTRTDRPDWRELSDAELDEQIELLVQFRDMKGGFPFHCHNTVHEDHQMMMLFNVAEVGDNNTRP